MTSNVLTFPGGEGPDLERHTRALERLARAIEVQNKLTVESHRREDRQAKAVTSERGQIATIQKIVAKVCGVKVAHLSNQQRAQCIARPRMMAMSLCCDHTKFTLPMIGRHFGGRDHTTVMHAVKRIAGLIETDDQVYADHCECEALVIAALEAG
jgi:chromosomal replication initiator protein